MRMITAILPAAAILFLLLIFSEYIRRVRQPEAAADDGDGATAVAAAPAMDRRDWLWAWGIALVYALVAFFHLGDTRAPATFYSQPENAALELSLPEGTEVASVRWYAGLRTGSWTVELSDDGETWQEVVVLEQNYVSLFKWNDTPLEAPCAARYVRLGAVGRPELGALVFYTGDGERILPEAFPAEAAALFDEEALIPETSTFLNSTYFDEIYHARTAYEGLRGETLYEITHPPLGKLILSAGILLFGMTPFGWRFMGTLFGALMLPILYAFVKRLFGRRRIAVGCTLIFAFDFMHYAQTRLATIDTYSVFFILLMYYYMYRFLSGTEERRRAADLALSGLFFGMGAASKWTCLYAGAGLGVLWLLYWVRSGRFLRRAFWKNVGWCLLFFVLVPAAIYYASYYPYGRAAGLSFPGMLFRPEYARLVWQNQLYMWHYHSSLVATHPYSSHWWQWVLDIRPILYYLVYLDGGLKSTIASFTHPLLCWGGLLAMLAALVRVFRQRDRKALFILLGFLAQLLPWIAVPRLTFAYHYFPSEVFLVLALGLVFDRIEDDGGAHWPLNAFVAASGAIFALFYPVLSGLPVSRQLCTRLLQWLGSWPL